MTEWSYQTKQGKRSDATIWQEMKQESEKQENETRKWDKKNKEENQARKWAS